MIGEAIGRVVGALAVPLVLIVLTVLTFRAAGRRTGAPQVLLYVLGAVLVAVTILVALAFFLTLIR